MRAEGASAFAGVPSVVPRPIAELGPLLEWLRAGRPAGERLDFAAGTALPDGRLDLCKQGLGAEGAALVAGALAEGPSPVRHLLLGTDGLGDEGAAAVAGTATDVETLYLGCNGITAGGACRIADQLRASPQVVTGVWLKRNPLGGGGGRAAAEIVESARSLRTLDLVQTGLDADAVAVLADALLAAAGNGRRIERLFV
ncbi:ribonuclease inhibitor, partial [Streptomyces sp. WAC 01325]